jgi:nicotinamidase-related amidase
MSRKKAIIIVDVQPAFLRKRHRVVEHIIALLEKNSYDLYVESTFHAGKGSLWDRQVKWILPRKEKTNSRILAVLPKNTVHIEKTTKSAFKGNKDLVGLLRKNNIKEAHIVGIDTNDCVLATAYESFDYGFYTYVIEHCCDSSASPALHTCAVALLRKVKLTKR